MGAPGKGKIRGGKLQGRGTPGMARSRKVEVLEKGGSGRGDP